VSEKRDLPTNKLLSSWLESYMGVLMSAETLGITETQRLECIATLEGLVEKFEITAREFVKEQISLLKARHSAHLWN
jgi:hypothetical protein